MLENLKSWWHNRRRRPLDELLAVEFDDAEVRVRVLAELDPEWNQSFRWSDIRRVCFEDGGLLSSDVVYVSLWDRTKPAIVPTAARGGDQFFGSVCDRGYFPERVWRRALGDTSGGLHCWPPPDEG